MLQFLEQPSERSGFRPTRHEGMEHLPVVEALGQRSLFAAVLHDVQDLVDDIEVAERNVVALRWKKQLDTFDPLCGNFQAQSVSTGP
jgi:hypothetical protein